MTRTAPQIVVMMILPSAPVAAKVTRMAHPIPTAKAVTIVTHLILVMAATRTVPLETNNNPTALTTLETGVKVVAVAAFLRR